MNSLFKNILVQVIVTTVLFGSQFSMAKAPVITSRELLSPPPRIIRTCCGFGVDIGIAGVPFAKKTDISSREIMGTHTFLGGKTEKNGNIYTRRGGFLDMGHLRDCGDWTAYLYNLIKAGQNDPNYVSLSLGNEGGAKSLVLNIPKDLDEDGILQMAGKISYDLSLWHEISTWFGASVMLVVPERFSSFSPEDMYSNLMGIHLAQRAIKSKLDYNEAMTLEISNMLDSLESVNTEQETYEAMAKVNEVWYTNEKKYPNKKILLKRYIDLDTALTPWLVPGYESKLPAYVLEKPDNMYSKYYELSLKLNFRFPVDTIFPEKSDRKITQNDFEQFIHYIQKEIIREDELKEVKELSKEEKDANKKHQATN